MFSGSLILPLLAQAFQGRKKYFYVARSDLNISFLKILQNHGYVLGFIIVSPKKLKVLVPSVPFANLRFTIYSRGSRRLFLSVNEIYPKYYFRSGLVVISTDRGLMSAQESVFAGLGGECLCFLSFI